MPQNVCAICKVNLDPNRSQKHVIGFKHNSSEVCTKCLMEKTDEIQTLAKKHTTLKYRVKQKLNKLKKQIPTAVAGLLALLACVGAGEALRLIPQLEPHGVLLGVLLGAYAKTYLQQKAESLPPLKSRK